MKKILCLMLCAILMIGIFPSAVYAELVENKVSSEKSAEKLYNLGLLRGTGKNSDGKPVFDLESEATRQEAVVMLVRLLGKETKALSGKYSQPFTDVDDWAVSYIAYAYKNKLIDGTSGTTFNGRDNVSAAQYLTFVLRALGYSSETDFTWDKAWELSDKIGITNGEYNEKTSVFLRSDLVVVSYNALSVLNKTGSRFIDVLVANGTVSITAAEKAGFVTDNRVPLMDGGYVIYDDNLIPFDVVPNGNISQNANYFNTEEYNAIEEKGFVSPVDEPLSTFASSVDTASYSLVRAKLRSGESVSPDMVQTEEFVNYFKYDYPQPTNGKPLAISGELGSCPWADGHYLLQIGVQAEKIDISDAPPCNLVFLIDVSGSMDDSNKLGLVRRSFMLLTENLRDIDRVSIVTYASSQDTLLDGATGDDKINIMSVIESLEAGGSTNGAGGIEAAYKCAERNFIEGGVNRVILATDGDFNVGVTSEGDLSKLISEKRETGIYLSVLGYGMGNYKNNKMETLAKDGNGNAYYIDSLIEARRVLVEQIGGTLNTVAKDVKLQVEFNPSGVKAYRLLGYENRMLAAQDFNDDSVDGGEVGSGYSVTALYEIIPAGSNEEVPGIDLKYQERVTVPSEDLLNIAVRYKLPDADESNLIERSVTLENFKETYSDNMRWAFAVAEFALSLRQSQYAKGASIIGALENAKSANYSSDPYRAEFVEILESLVK